MKTIQHRIFAVLSLTVLVVALGCETYRPAPPRHLPPPPSPTEVKAMSAAGLADEVILSQIRNSHAAYRLTTEEIIDLKNGGVSQKIIDFMINSPSLYRSLTSAKPYRVPSGNTPSRCRNRYCAPSRRATSCRAATRPSSRPRRSGCTESDGNTRAGCS